MVQLRSYRTMEEFEREEIRPGFRIGFCLDDIEDTGFEGELCFGDQGDLFELDAVGESSEIESEFDDDDD